jgi:selenocysteine lyase/cysteine desulfurase
LRHVFEELVEKVRQDIKALLELDAAAEVVLSPSGTDSELHAFS